jgi:hypothetical protein
MWTDSPSVLRSLSVSRVQQPSYLLNLLIFAIHTYRLLNASTCLLSIAPTNKQLPLRSQHDYHHANTTMLPSLLHTLSLLLLLTIPTTAQTPSNSSSGYTDYTLSLTGDPNSVIYETSSTASNPNTTNTFNTPPDVYLNASVHVSELSISVTNLSAKINLDAQVLSLLQFNAGIDLSIARVSLAISNVTAKVLLEARLENLVRMIEDTLDSIDLNPVLATIG